MLAETIAVEPPFFYSASAFIGETHPKSIRSLRSQHFARSAPLSDFVSTGVPFLPPRYQKMYNDLSQIVLTNFVINHYFEIV